VVVAAVHKEGLRVLVVLAEEQTARTVECNRLQLRSTVVAVEAVRVEMVAKVLAATVVLV
jgi:hypothetical protein